MTSKLKKSPLSDFNAVNKRIENTWVLLIPDSLFENNNFSIITLPHPTNGRPTKYCLNPIDKSIYEIVSYCEPNRSWFIGDTVKSDGRLHICTLINPIFLVLPRLKSQCNNKAVPIKDLLSEKGYDKIIDYIHNLDDIADLKGPEELKAYKYNEEKTLNWLKRRVDIVAKIVKEKNIHVSSSAVSATFVPSTLENGDVDEELYVKYAFGIVSEYLEDNLITQLEKSFKFKAELVEHLSKKRKSEIDNCNLNKKIKVENDNFVANCVIDNKSIESKKLKLTAKEKARQKAASGTKAISAFFMKKS